MTALSELREKVEGASGDDRDLDGMIEAFFATNKYGDVLPAKGGMVVYAGPAPHGPGTGRFEAAEHYTSSIDAALALVERTLPGSFPQIGKDHRDFLNVGEPDWGCTLMGPCNWANDPETNYPEPHIESHAGRGATAPLAILSALLRALEAKDTGHGG